MTYFYLSLAILAETIATLALKSSQGFTVLGPTLLVLCGYGLAFYCLSLTLDQIPVGLVYATWSGLGILLITLGGYFLYGQTPDLYAWIGLGFIILGVFFINILSSSTAH